MSQALDFLAIHWLAVVLLAVGAVLAVLAVRSAGRRWSLFLLAGGLACAAVGDLALPAEWAWWVLAVAGALFVSIAIALSLTSAWWPPLAYLTVALGCLALGALALGPLGHGFVDAGESLLTLEFLRPWWLAGLVLLPVLVFLSWPRLNRSEPRPWVSLALRCLLVLFLVLALAEPRLKQQARNVTVLFVLDRSQSVPQEFDDSVPPVDLRQQRVLKFINEAVEGRGAGRSRDEAGLIVFGRRPRLELPPSDAPRFNLRETPEARDGSNTDISGALKLALASFPEGTARRIVLISDGNENVGDALEVARLARSLGVQIDVLPLAADQTNQDEILVERVTAPAVIEQGSRVPIRVLIRSFNPNPVVGRLTLQQITSGDASLKIKLGPDGRLGVDVEGTDGLLRGVRVSRVEADSLAGKAGIQAGDRIVQIDGEEVTDPAQFNGLLAKKAGKEVTVEVRGTRATVIADRQAQLVKGLNPFAFDPPLTDQEKSYTYEAEFYPQFEVDAKGNRVRKGPFPGDRVQNNRASTHVVARGQGRILLLEGQPGTHQELVRDLVGAGDKKFKVIAQPVSLLDNYKERAKLAVFLSNFDCVILANVAADQVSAEQQEVLRSNTHDQGCGLVMIGGPDSFGAGGWQKTPVEKALPVDCDIKSLKVQGKGALVLLMHASEMADGNRWQKVIGRLAVERLGPLDEVGVLDWGFGARWYIPLQPVAGNKRSILSQLDKLMPGDMPDFDPALDMAYKALTAKEEEYATKHIIIISDGDPNCTMTRLPRFKNKKITITTVGVATHGANEDQKMALIAKATGGRYYGPRTRPGTSDPKNLPAIYIKETRLVSQSFVHQQKNPFEPVVHFRSGPTRQLPDQVPGITGFVRTTPKSSPLVQIPIETPKFAEQDFPLLAFWHYGLGKAVAFTSDAGKPKFWSQRWAEGKQAMFAKFWDQVIEWSLRPTESSRLSMETDYRDGKIHVTVRATTEDGKPDVGLKLRAGLSRPRSGNEGGGEDREKRHFVQSNSGVYELEVKAEDAGSYFITAQATRLRKVKGPDGVEREVEEGVDSVRAGVTVPYSPEFAELRSNTTLLDRIREMTGGETYIDNEETLADAAGAGTVFRPAPARIKSWQALWYWLLVLTCVLLVADVAVRRLAVDPDQVRAGWERTWARLRGLPIPEPGREEVFERLQARRRPEGEALGARRFEGGARVPGLPLGVDVAGPMPTDRPAATRPQTGPGMGPSGPEAPAEDFQSRLLRAKKKARGGQDETEQE
jgi:Mg-chelatase subunit ChlD